MSDQQTKTIKQVFDEYLAEQEKLLAPRTYKYHQDAVAYLAHCLNGYGHGGLNEADAKKFDEAYKKGIEFCDLFETQILDAPNFAEFLGYFYPKKVAGGRDAAKKVCGATINLYKWLVKNKYLLQEEDGDGIELSEAVAYLRDAFNEGMEQYCNYNEIGF